VTKDLASAKKLVQNQFDELKDVHKKLIENMERMETQATEIQSKLQELIPQQ
jgi:prefoldin subunit 5